jgi:NADH-quinone oxidoreductase subunit J
MVAQNLFFYAIAAVIIVGGIRVVTCRNVVHAALWLVLVLAGIAGQFLLLAAEFIAATQVLVYLGAIVVLFLFGIMLTRARIGEDQDLTGPGWRVGAFTAVILFAVMAYALIDEWGWSETPLPADTRIQAVDGSNTATVGDAVFSTYVVPFQAVSVMLLAALIGAIVFVRKDRG